MSTSAAYDRFMRSMKIGFDEWHDGTGYDLAALEQVTPQERAEIERILVRRNGEDWRDVEALDALRALGSSLAAGAIEDVLKDESADTTARLHAAKALRASDAAAGTSDGADVAALLKRAGAMDGLSKALELAEQNPTPLVRQALLWCAKNHRDGTTAVNSAGLLYYLAGLSSEAFDWAHRPFFLRFHSDDPADRAAAFLELCEKIGVDPASVD